MKYKYTKRRVVNDWHSAKIIAGTLNANDRVVMLLQYDAIVETAIPFKSMIRTRRKRA